MVAEREVGDGPKEDDDESSSEWEDGEEEAAGTNIDPTSDEVVPKQKETAWNRIIRDHAKESISLRNLLLKARVLPLRAS